MAFICRINVTETNLLLCHVKLKCSQLEISDSSALLDTGAGVCHMTYPMWLDMGLNELCWNNNPQLCKLMGISSPDKMEFDKLPLTSTISILGDGSEARVYEFRLDTLVLGKPSLGFNHTIALENITIRLINRNNSAFIVGWNVLKYLDVIYAPTLNESIYQLSYKEDGRQLFQQDCQNKIANYMQNMFNYQQQV